MKVKTLLCLVLALSLVLVFEPVYAQGTLFVSPSSIVDTTKIPGSTFTITVDIDAGVTNLWGFEFKFWYNTAILTATVSTPSTDFPDVSMNMIDDVKGLVWVAANLPMGTTVGLNGPRTLVTITFSVDSIGRSILNIDEDYTTLISAAGTEITPTIVDGHFSNTVLGDVNWDGKVDSSDLSIWSKACGSDSSKPNWDPKCDFNWDDKVDVSDLFGLGKNYGKSI